MRPGLLDPGPFYDHHHHGPSGPLMQPPLAGMTVTSRYKCRVWYILMKDLQPPHVGGTWMRTISYVTRVLSKNRVVRRRRRSKSRGYASTPASSQAPHARVAQWRGGRGRYPSKLRFCVIDLIYAGGFAARPPRPLNKNCIPLGNETRTKPS